MYMISAVCWFMVDCTDSWNRDWHRAGICRMVHPMTRPANRQASSDMASIAERPTRVRYMVFVLGFGPAGCCTCIAIRLR
ncbi:MAG: hypothetical protein Ct9H300mP1_05180 [Planctomycetaceae bacterium]|nr:MAG: hypothetical protein Ct9H300mP1_05180 [Planctomycetaceae bacterium]